MFKWVTTENASEIKKVGLGSHQIARLARQGSIEAKRLGKKKWLVKVALIDNNYKLVPLESSQHTSLEEFQETDHTLENPEEESLGKPSSTYSEPITTIDELVAKATTPDFVINQLQLGHQQQMLKIVDKWTTDITSLVEQLRGEICIPNLIDYFPLKYNNLPETKPSPVPPFIPDPDPRSSLIVKYLLEHLSSSDIPGLKIIYGKNLFSVWEDISNKEVNLREEFVNRIVTRTYGLTEYLPREN